VRKGPFLEELKALEPEIVIVVAYGKILPAEVLKAPKRGCLNVHASLLPKYRGAAPIQWAIIRGEKETGVTLMQMDEGMDTGDMLLEKKIPIDDQITSGEMFSLLSKLGAEVLVEGLAKLDSLVPRKQDHAQATMAPMLEKETGKVDFSLGA